MKSVFRGTLIGLLIFAVIPTWAETQGSVSLSEAGFVSPDYRLTEKKDFQFFSGGLDTLSNRRTESEMPDALHAQVRGMISPGSSVLNYLNVSQLFWKQQALNVGRKKMNWSELDERFHLGMYQPLFQWNPLMPEEQGLTGIFLNLQADESAIPWGVTLLGSPLYIPNQGASYELKDGKFQNTNPYFSPQFKYLRINGGLSPINYEVQKPETQDIVFRQSFAGKVYLGNERKGFFSQLSFANKPTNDLSLGFQGYGLSDNTATVEIQPQVARHNLFSGDIHFTGSFYQFGVSAVREAIQAAVFKEEWTYVRYSDSILLSPFVAFRAFNTELQLSALSVQGAEATAIGPEANQAEKFLPQRYPFRNAGLAQLKYSFRMKRSQKLQLSTRYLRGEKGEFDLWTSEAAYQWSDRWTAQLASQMIAIDQTSGKTVFDSYVNNDLVSVGVKYVF
jgi:hypothetical protein